MKNTNRQPSSGSVLLGMAAGAALGAVGTMAMAQNQRQVKRTARKLAKGAERAMSQLDTMVTDLVERRMDLGGQTKRQGPRALPFCLPFTSGSRYTSGRWC